MITYLQIENLTKSWGDKLLFEDISFSIGKNDKVALIAKNGTGKTSLLNIITKHDVADSGKVTFRNDIKFAYLTQNTVLPKGFKIIDAVLNSSSEIVNVVKEYENAIKSDDKKRLENAYEQMDINNAWEYESNIKHILTKLQITDYDQLVDGLSGGQKKRIALAGALISNPDILILDEPTNHLDVEMIEWLELFLTKSHITLLMVTHDRYFLDKVCTKIIEIDNNNIYSYNGNYSYFLEKREERVQLMKMEIEKSKNLLKTELDWMRRQPQARGTKAKYRINAFYELEDKATNNIKDEKVKFDIQTTRLGNKIIEIKKLYKSFGDLKLIEDFSYIFQKNEKIGIIGKNGTGKSTFLNLITENLQADSGVIEHGTTLVIGYYKQEGLQLKEDSKIIDYITDIAEVVNLGSGSTLSASQFLQLFLFSPEMQYNYISKLSGGEKRRLYLVSILMKNPNFLILDEPTNDLDITTLNILENYLNSFQGCVITITHDRYFMDKSADHLFVFEGNGKIKDFPGNYSAYREQLAKLEKVSKKEKKSNSDEKPKRQKPVAKVKMSYKEKCELEALEKDIDDLNTEKSDVENKMNSGELQSEELVEKSKRFNEIVELLDDKELRWLELSELL